MDRVSKSGGSNVREFFTGQLQEVMEKRNISARIHSFEYLVDLLVHHIDSDKFFAKDADGKLRENVLVELYSEYLKGDSEGKRKTLRRLGDICLLITGLFPDSLKRKLVDIDYYFGMGGTAYWQLSHLHFGATAQALFKELAVKFKLFSNVLGEMSERGGVQTNSDLLRLYERWLLTGSERLRELLSEHGIAAPVKMDLKVRH